MLLVWLQYVFWYWCWNGTSIGGFLCIFAKTVRSGAGSQTPVDCNFSKTTSPVLKIAPQWFFDILHNLYCAHSDQPPLGPLNKNCKISNLIISYNIPNGAILCIRIVDIRLYIVWYFLRNYILRYTKENNWRSFGLQAPILCYREKQTRLFGGHKLQLKVCRVFNRYGYCRHMLPLCPLSCHILVFPPFFYNFFPGNGPRARETYTPAFLNYPHTSL